MRVLHLARLGVLLLSLPACGGSAAPAEPPIARPIEKEKKPPQAQARTLDQRLSDAEQHFSSSHYARAEAEFGALQQAASSPRQAALRARSTLGLARVRHVRGEYAQAEEIALSIPQDGSESATEATLLIASALTHRGHYAEAERALATAVKNDRAPALRLALGEVLIQLGRRTDAEPVLMTIVEDYNNDTITAEDGRGLSIVGRAAHLLRSPEDANDAFNQAEQVLVGDPQTLLWRSELYLEKFDPGHAEEVISELLEQSPNHPEALAVMAEVKLAQALDFAEARRLVEQAREVNPNLAAGFFVLAGLSLRDMDLEQAAHWVAEGLEVNPRDLPLLSMRATERFLADDSAGFDAVRDQVLALNPEYSRFYQIVGEYAEWEHRYDEIVSLMRQAVNIDQDDARAHAQLGLNLIRNGDDRAGLQALGRSFAKDPYNVRVYNTLNLFEKVIPKSYTDVKGDRFNFRYPSVEKPILERYVPDLMNQAWGQMVKFYDFTPLTPVGVELYAERENFAIRTSGLPQTAIQGVCFGKTLASMSPRHEQFNLGMTLWHELAHVFHIQLSKNHVPRWFTEGLAEYETLVERTEWKRERDAELYDALREQRLPKIGAMNEAFTHAEDLSDVTVAYYASTQIVKMLAEQYGRPKLREMLVLWGRGKRTPEVLQVALGATADELDAAFSVYLANNLAAFSKQFVPRQRVGNSRKVKELAKERPNSPDALSRYALLLSSANDIDAAQRTLDRALKLEPEHPDSLWLKARLALRQNNGDLATRVAKQLVSSGHDGYETQLVLAKAASMQKNEAAQTQALARAYSFDQTRSDAPYGLLHLAKEQGDAQEVERWLHALHTLEEHNGEIYYELTDRLTKAGRTDEAVAVGESAVFAAMESVDAHLAYAAALAAAGKHAAAEFEFVSATLCPAAAPEIARAHLLFAKYLSGRGLTRRASEQVEKAKTFKLPPAP